MRINSRIKGKTGEIELAAILNGELGCKLKRNLQQTREGGFDLVDESGLLNEFSIEVKRGKKYLHDWWLQTVVQAYDCKRIPILAYRLDRYEWRFEIPIGLMNESLGTYFLNACSEFGKEAIFRDEIKRLAIQVPKANLCQFGFCLTIREWLAK